MLAQKPPVCDLKVKPHTEFRLKTLKREWIVVYDMIHGMHTSGFGRMDDNKHMFVVVLLKMKFGILIFK